MTDYTPKDLLHSGDSIEASGHPSECTEPATGSISTSDETGTTSNDNIVLNKNNSSLDFPSHGHDTDGDGNCTDDQSHNLTPDIEETGLRLNGENVLITGTIQNTDPVTNGSITDV